MDDTGRQIMIREELFALQDLKYKDFQAKLIPTVDKSRIIGVRTPDLRKLAREFGKRPESQEFLKTLPHTYYEEDNLHVCLIESGKDYEEVIEQLTTFLPYVDNWATCDSISPKVFKQHGPKLLEKCKEWIASEHTYTIRFGIGMLMQWFLDENFDPAYLALVADISSEEYYVNMMIAWYFATALAKQYDAALPYITEGRLPVWVNNKTIQKAVESRRITAEQKEYLKKWKRKK